MDPPYHNSPPFSFLDLNVEDHHDQNHHLFNLNPQTCSSNLSLSSPSNFVNIPPQEHQGQFYYREPQRIHQLLQVQDQADNHHKIVSFGGSSCDHPRAAESHESDHHHDLKLSIWKSTTTTEDENDGNKISHVTRNQKNDNTIDSVKWMPSKMRMMRKMIIMNPDHHQSSAHKPYTKLIFLAPSLTLSHFHLLFLFPLTAAALPPLLPLTAAATLSSQQPRRPTLSLLLLPTPTPPPSLLSSSPADAALSSQEGHHLSLSLLLLPPQPPPSLLGKAVWKKKTQLFCF